MYRSLQQLYQNAVCVRVVIRDGVLPCVFSELYTYWSRSHDTAQFVLTACGTRSARTLGRCTDLYSRYTKYCSSKSDLVSEVHCQASFEILHQLYEAPRDLPICVQRLCGHLYDNLGEQAVQIYTAVVGICTAWSVQNAVCVRVLSFGFVLPCAFWELYTYSTRCYSTT